MMRKRLNRTQGEFLNDECIQLVGWAKGFLASLENENVRIVPNFPDFSSGNEPENLDGLSLFSFDILRPGNEISMIGEESLHEVVIKSSSLPWKSRAQTMKALVHGHCPRRFHAALAQHIATTDAKFFVNYEQAVRLDASVVQVTILEIPTEFYDNNLSPVTRSGAMLNKKDDAVSNGTVRSKTRPTHKMDDPSDFFE